MHQLVPLLVVLASQYLQEVFSASHPPYPPPGYQGGLQPPFRHPASIYPPVPPGPSDPYFTFAEVNTPYYHYHYYAPVYNKHLVEPPFLESSTPESSFRNEVNTYNHRGSSVPPNLFYPASSIAQKPLNDLPKSIPPDGCVRPYCDPQILQQPRVYSDLQGAPFPNSKPYFRNEPYAPSFTTYQSVPRDRFPLFQPQGNPLAIPSDFATTSPNIIRDNFKEKLDSQNDLNPTPFGPSFTSVNPLYPTSAPPYQPSKPLFIAESFATPSSNIVKDEIRRGAMFKPDPSQIRNSSDVPTLLKDSNVYIFPPIQPSTLNPQLELSPSPSDSSKEEDEVEAKITYIDFPQNSRPQLPSRSSTPRSIVLSTDIIVEDPDSEDIDRSLFSNNLDSIGAKNNESNTTVSHTQKIAPKVHPKEDVEKHIYKHPNVLFDAPGHDTP